MKYNWVHLIPEKKRHGNGKTCLHPTSCMITLVLCFPAPFVLNRLWFLLCTAKFIIWKSRCIHVFQSHLHSGVSLVSSIENDIINRVKADKMCLSVTNFRTFWIINRSFVSLSGNKLYFTFNWLAPHLYFISGCVDYVIALVLLCFGFVV